MFRIVLRSLAAITALTLVATPAAAQQFSQGYQFLKAIRDEDGTKVNEILNRPGVRIVNTRDRVTGEGALHIVVKRSDPTYLRFLLQRDANANLQDDDGNSPMLLATNLGWVEGVRILIAYRADVNLANTSGETPLIRAVQSRNLELVRMLLAANADPDKADVLAGMSARDYALADSRAPAIKRALEEAARVSREGVSGPVLN